MRSSTALLYTISIRQIVWSFYHHAFSGRDPRKDQRFVIFAHSKYHRFMWVAITRKTLDGEVVGPDQALTREEALRFHTVWAAYSTFEEDLKGSLEPGKFADLAVLTDDYLSVEEDEIDEIKNIRPLLTMVGGKVVYRDPDYTFP